MLKYFTATTSAAMMTEIKKTTSVGVLSLMAGLLAGAPAHAWKAGGRDIKRIDSMRRAMSDLELLQGDHG